MNITLGQVRATSRQGFGQTLRPWVSAACRAVSWLEFAQTFAGLLITFRMDRVREVTVRTRSVQEEPLLSRCDLEVKMISMRRVVVRRQDYCE